jgi:hypothetical protein
MLELSLKPKLKKLCTKPHKTPKHREFEYAEEEEKTPNQMKNLFSEFGDGENQGVTRHYELSSNVGIHK